MAVPGRGAAATPLVFGEVHLGLKTGTVDGQDDLLPTVLRAERPGLVFRGALSLSLPMLLPAAKLLGVDRVATE